MGDPEGMGLNDGGPRDVKPYTPVATLDRNVNDNPIFDREGVAEVVGMQPSFIRKVLGTNSPLLSAQDVVTLLDQDAYAETFVPRSRVINYLMTRAARNEMKPEPLDSTGLAFGSAGDLIPRLAPQSVQTVVTSTPYWAMRVYDDMRADVWADGEVCPYGLEQTPEGFIRHSVELIVSLKRAMKPGGSIWWNLGDTYNTRTQIRGNAAEALRAMQGKDRKTWHDHAARRYSAGHSYLKDGEQCLIPQRIAERASRAGFYVKSIITWGKPHSMPEPQNSRVSRAVEYVIHLSLQRTPDFYRNAYLETPEVLGGKGRRETDKLSDSWLFAPSDGRGGHGAQFPLALPGRCISISSQPGDLVLDPFMGSGTTAIAAERLGRRWLGFDVSETYLNSARIRVENSRQQDLLTLEREDVGELV
ncbi:site-specific DNA-methyltransferase [Kocuria flava]|uniref:DNA-methyltransferase n=1 Tax=Kocuria flava TaxID=446860 RepID=UPI001FF4C592|nr:site-specific DNA-methyltransferase [Kocuria flava]MCJ8506093.1 site-specific DNA-methyltransferase [Kocuria flava]